MTRNFDKSGMDGNHSDGKSCGSSWSVQDLGYLVAINGKKQHQMCAPTRPFQRHVKTLPNMLSSTVFELFAWSIGL